MYFPRIIIIPYSWKTNVIVFLILFQLYDYEGSRKFGTTGAKNE